MSASPGLRFLVRVNTDLAYVEIVPAMPLNLCRRPLPKSRYYAPVSRLFRRTALYGAGGLEPASRDRPADVVGRSVCARPPEPG